MKSKFMAATAVLFFGSAFCAFAQQPEEHPQEVKPPAQSEPRHENEKPAREREAKPQQEKHEQAKPQDQMKPEQNRKEEMKPEQLAGEQPKAGRPAGKSQHIPDEKFRASFGREHHFKVSRPVVVEGRPQFIYSGYTFVLVDAWPADWAYSDDVYVEYVDGEYFLYDLLHPGIRIALFVSF